MQKEVENLVQAVYLLKVEPGFESTQSGSLNLCAVLRLVVQSFLTLCDPMDCSPPGSSVHGDSPGKNTGVGGHVFLQGNLPNPGTEPRSSMLQVILYCLNHQGSPRMLEWAAYLFSRGTSQPRSGIRVSCIAAELPNLQAMLIHLRYTPMSNF